MAFRLGNWFTKTYVILNNRIVLYIILFLSIVDLYIFAVNGELLYVAIFVIIGFLTAFFSKNMTVILFMAMILTNILRYGKDVGVKEGMEDASDANIPEVVNGDEIDEQPTAANTKTASVDEISEKINGLDEDTLNLLKKQKKIIENMQNLEPLLKNAEGFLANFNR